MEHEAPERYFINGAKGNGKKAHIKYNMTRLSMSHVLWLKFRAMPDSYCERELKRLLEGSLEVRRCISIESYERERLFSYSMVILATHSRELYPAAVKLSTYLSILMASNHSLTSRKEAKSGVFWSSSGLMGLKSRMIVMKDRYQHFSTGM